MSVQQFISKEQKQINTFSELFEQRMLMLMAEMFKEGNRCLVGGAGFRINENGDGVDADPYTEEDLLELISFTTFRCLAGLTDATINCGEDKAAGRVWVWLDRLYNLDETFEKLRHAAP